jgi:hypothetical protein
MRSYDLEESILARNKVFEMICAKDAQWGDAGSSRAIPFRGEDYARVGTFYASWLEAAK